MELHGLREQGQHRKASGHPLSLSTRRFTAFSTPNSNEFDGKKILPAQLAIGIFQCNILAYLEREGYAQRYPIVTANREIRAS